MLKKLTIVLSVVAAEPAVSAWVWRKTMRSPVRGLSIACPICAMA